ncbi:hypothetical protein [Methanomethylovorans sp.]|uniref:hypothetical protein n=1 Tax=Methanomethylovorans sp. TaxID=2758717 RepID=UPI00351C4831
MWFTRPNKLPIIWPARPNRKNQIFTDDIKDGWQENNCQTHLEMAAAGITGISNGNVAEKQYVN